MTLTRLLLVRCPGLETPGEEEDGGRGLRRFARVVEALAEVCPWIDVVRPGVCALPIKGPTRYFGSEQAVLDLVRETVAAEMTRHAGDGPETADASPRLGVAEGVFAATLAAGAGAVVPPGRTAGFLAPWPVDVLGDPELADVLVRLGLTTLGRFAALHASDVVARFGAAGVRRHRVARGEEGELPGSRVPGMERRLVAVLGRELSLLEHQPGFWGGTSAADERAAEVLTALQRKLGTEAVTVPVVGGGRGPSDRCRLVPWRPRGAQADRGAAGTPARAAPDREPADRPPWPGRLPRPAPARVAAASCPAALCGGDGAPVAVTGRGLLTARPARLSVDGGPWRTVTAWSAPWPVEERWWSRGRRRAARLQVLTDDATAHLLLVERGCWRVEATYD